MLTRSQRILNLTKKDDSLLERLDLPVYESTKGTTKWEQENLRNSKYLCI